MIKGREIDMFMKSIDDLMREVDDLMREVDGRIEANKIKDCDKEAKKLHNVYESYIKTGFTEEQAWDLLKTVHFHATKRAFEQEDK